MQRMALRDLAVGELFVRQDQWGDGRTLHIKLSVHGRTEGDGNCFCGMSNGSTNVFVGGMIVQPIETSETIKEIFYALAHSPRRA